VQTLLGHVSTGARSVLLHIINVNPSIIISRPSVMLCKSECAPKKLKAALHLYDMTEKHEATTAEIPPRYEPNICYVGGSSAARYC